MMSDIDELLTRLVGKYQNRQNFQFYECNRDGEEAASTIRQLQSEITRLKAEAQTAWEAGRDAAGEEVICWVARVDHGIVTAAIRNLKRTQDGEK
jgi:formyltetrahydrofolate hydrolase